MGEKPTAEDEAAARSMDKASPELMAAREASAPSLSEIAVGDPLNDARVFPETNREGFAINEPGAEAAKGVLGDVSDTAKLRNAPERPPRPADAAREHLYLKVERKGGGDPGLAVDEPGADRVGEGKEWKGDTPAR